MNQENKKRGKVDMRKIGKQNRARGLRFESSVRKDLESKGWNVCKFSNNVDLKENKLIPVKNKFRGIGVPMMLGAGFPDFFAFVYSRCWNCVAHNFGKCSYNVIGVECKSNGCLDKIEKEKCRWLLENNVFRKILIASKSKKRGEIIYKEFNSPQNINKESGKTSP